MRTSQSGISGKLAAHFAVLVIAGLQAGCALSAADSQSPMAALLSPLASLNIGIAESPAQACITAARKLERKGQTQAAIAKYEDARRLDSAAPVGHALALLYNHEGNVERAKTEFEVALQANSKDFELLNDMAGFAFEHGNVTEAEKLLRQSLAIKPGNERACVSLGLVLGRLGRYEESYDAFTNILSRDEARANNDAIAAKPDKPADTQHVSHVTPIKPAQPTPEASSSEAEHKPQ